jgi:hypothetical protein
VTAETFGPDRCPKCGAAVKAGDPWCTLCYADLRPPAPPPPDPPDLLRAPAPYAGSVASGPDPLTAPLDAVTGEPAGELAGPTWPCATCATVNPMDRDTCAGCGSAFLSALREQNPPLLELPVVGDITRLGRGQRFALAGGVVLAFLLLTLVLGLLLS